MLAARRHTTPAACSFFRRPRPTSPARPRSRAYLAPLHRTKWFVYSKAAVRRARSRCWPICPATPTGFAYLQQPPHRAADGGTGVTFQLQGLPDRGTRPLQNHDASSRTSSSGGFLNANDPAQRIFHRIRHYGSASQRHQDRDHRGRARQADCCGHTCPNGADARQAPDNGRRQNESDQPVVRAAAAA